MADRASVEHWVESLFSAWQHGEPDIVPDLFSPDAEYRSHPFREPRRGRDEIAAYWRNAVAVQENLQVSVGSPLVVGNRAAVEWWVNLTENGNESVSTGTLFLTFDDGGLCTSLREVWTEMAGRLEPYEGWGE